MATKTYGVIAVFSLSCCLLGSSFARAQAKDALETRATVGVLRPKVSTGIEDMMAKVPPESRAMVAAQMASMARAYGEALPRIVQHTWVEMLERRGLRAVNLDAETAEGAGADQAKEIGARWLLKSAVVAKATSAAGGGMAVRGVVTQGQNMNVDLTLRYELVDLHGHNGVPERVNTISGVVDNEGVGTDVWADAGDGMITTIISALPLGTVKTTKITDAKPELPSMAESVRFDLTITERNSYNGKQVGPVTQKKLILEFAGGSVTTEEQNMGIICSQGSPRMFVVNDKARVYYTMEPSDFDFAKAMAPQAGDGPSGAVKLVRSGDGKMVHYTLERGASPVMGQAAAQGMSGLPGKYRSRIEGTTSQEEGSIDVEYGEPSPAWQGGMRTMNDLFGKTGVWPDTFGHNGEVSKALWTELQASAAPPVRIVMRSVDSTRYKQRKPSEMVSETVMVFETPSLARQVDFTIPNDYKWHTNLMLGSAFVH